MRFNDVLSIIKKHGLYNGLRRIRDEFFENYLFDLVNKTSTREIVVKKNYSKLFYNNNDNKKKILMLRGGGGQMVSANLCHTFD
jgi:hypothetical protein